MTSTQLILLALTCINENREPSHAEQSRIYVFFDILHALKDVDSYCVQTDV